MWQTAAPLNHPEDTALYDRLHQERTAFSTALILIPLLGKTILPTGNGWQIHKHPTCCLWHSVEQGATTIWKASTRTPIPTDSAEQPEGLIQPLLVRYGRSLYIQLLVKHTPRPAIARIQTLFLETGFHPYR